MRISGNMLFLRCNEHPRRLSSRLWINKLLAGCHQLCVGNTTVNLGRPNCLFHYHRESKLCKYLPLSTLKIAQNGRFVKKKNQTRLQLSNEKGLALFLKSSDPPPPPSPVPSPSMKINIPIQVLYNLQNLHLRHFGLIDQKLLKFDLCTFKIFLNIMISFQTVI